MFPTLILRTTLPAALVIIVLALNGCGSGSSTPNTPPTTVSSVSAANPAVGKLTTFTISGNNLSANITPVTTGCSGLVVINSTSTTSRQFTCTPDGPSIGVSVSGGTSTPYLTSFAIPAVTSVTATGIAFGKTITFSIVGANFPTNVAATATACANIVHSPSTSSTLREFSCTPEGINVPLSIDYGGATPYLTNIAVPLPQVTFVTSLGNVVVELYPDKAPISVKNFLTYVGSDFYSNTVFHRAVPGFVTQGGGFVSDPTNKIAQKANSTAPIVLESNNGLSNLKYTVAMARTSIPNSATSQFYFNAANNTNLDYNPSTPGANGYAVFGKAISGTAVLDSMNAVANATYGSFLNVPITDLVLQSATRTQ